MTYARFCSRVILCFLLTCAIFSQQAWGRSAVQVKEGVLLVAFGTSVPEAKISLDQVKEHFHSALPDRELFFAYTSQLIRKKLAQKGQKTGGISEGLAKLATDGAKIVRIQPLHVMAGEEFNELERAVLLDLQKYPGRFTAVYLGRPLLESRKDAVDVAKAVLNDLKGKRKQDEALVLMAHGQEQGRAGLVFEGVREIFTEQDPLTFLATVEGQRGFAELLAELKKHSVKKVWLQPLMVVAGDHARNDLAGNEADSWASQLQKEGFIVATNLKGLGEVPGVADIYLRHISETKDDLVKEPKKL